MADSIMKNKTLLKRIALLAITVSIVAVTIIISAGNFSKANALKESVKQISEECKQVEEDISEKQELINGNGFDEYCEKIAREKYGYAKPGEYVIYDSSYGK